jgi:Malic enzyme, NAD binding domain
MVKVPAKSSLLPWPVPTMSCVHIVTILPHAVMGNSCIHQHVKACMLLQAKEVSDKMFASAAQRLADYVTPESFDEGKIYPDLSDLRDISLKVSIARLLMPALPLPPVAVLRTAQQGHSLSCVAHALACIS